MKGKPRKTSAYIEALMPFFCFMLILFGVSALCGALFRELATMSKAFRGHEKAAQKVTMLLANTTVLAYCFPIYSKSHKGEKAIKAGFDRLLLLGAIAVCFNAVGRGMARALYIILIKSSSSVIGTADFTVEAKWGLLGYIDILTIALIGPIAEETIFRGLVYPNLRKVTTNSAAVIISSALFGVSHVTQPFVMLYAFMTGALASFLYKRYNSLIAPIFLHMAINLSNYIYLFPFADRLFASSKAFSLSIYIIISSSALVCLLFLALRDGGSYMGSEAKG